MKKRKKTLWLFVIPTIALVIAVSAAVAIRGVFLLSSVQTTTPQTSLTEITRELKNTVDDGGIDDLDVLEKEITGL